MDHIITGSPSNGGYYNSNSKATIQPGDRIILRGTFTHCAFYALEGTQEAPIDIIVEEDALIEGNGNYGLLIQGKHWKLNGNNMLRVVGSPLRKLINLLVVGSSSDFEVKNIKELTNGIVGILGNPKDALPYGPIRSNMMFDNINIYDIKNGKDPGVYGTCEAVYLGNTGLTNLAISQNNVTFKNMNLERLEGDGIQAAVTQNILIENVKIRDFGRKNVDAHNVGIIVGGSSQATIKNTSVENGTGTGLQIFGVNKTYVENTIFANVATGNAKYDGIYINKKSTETADLTVEMKNVKVSGAKRYGLKNEGTVAAKSVVLRDCSIQGIAGALNGPNITQVTTPAPETDSTGLKVFFNGVEVEVAAKSINFVGPEIASVTTNNGHVTVTTS